MDLKKRLKSVALAGMTFAAGFGAYHATHSDSGKRSHSGETVSYQKITKDSYELRAGVLMPLANESVADYEARRLRLEKQENKLRERMLKHYQEKLKQLKSQNASDTLIDMCEDRLEEHQKVAQYFSFYTDEGQQKLKVFNENQNRLNSIGCRSGRSYDF